MLNAKTCQSKVRIAFVEESLNGELAEVVMQKCSFCEKKTVISLLNKHVCSRLSGNKFYCTNCLRQGFNRKNNKNILVISFRGIIGYFYHDFYLSRKRMWLSEINDYLNLQEEAGLKNPVFQYDPETFLWFIDFNRVGKSRRKVRIEDVLKTIVNILACFNLPQNFPEFKTAIFFKKYRDAIMSFYYKRSRPDGKRILSPTLTNCLLDHLKNNMIEKTKAFSLKDMKEQ